jgi:hypothetical protein
MSFVKKSVATLAVVALISFAARYAIAGGGHCDGCGCGCGDGSKVCRLVCEEKEIEVTCYDSKCEDFCEPGPCKMGCKHCERVCTDCNGKGCDGCATACTDCSAKGCHGGCGGGFGLFKGGKKICWRTTIPGCARIFTKKELLTKTVTKKVKVYKWVLEDLCDGCKVKAKDMAPVVPADGADVPPPPEVDAAFIYGKTKVQPVRLRMEHSVR